MEQENQIIEILKKYDPQEAVIRLLQNLRKQYANQQSEFVKKIEGIMAEKRWGEQGLQGIPGKSGYTPVKGIDYTDGETVDTEALKQEILAGIPIPQNGIDGQDAPPIDMEALLKEVVAQIPVPKDGKDATVDEDAIVESLIERLKKKKELDISHIRNSGQFTYKGTKYNMYEMMHGAGSGNATSSITYSVDLSSQCNGVNKIFTVPTNTAFILLTGSDAPLIYRPTVDYTGSGTITLTLDAGVNAPSSGATLILTYKAT